ncbi:MAG TPA: nucleoside triphosphate pyrophosphohydrolase [Bacilli bacterium]|nr:nucleoside triphosphate pyrophosphohydrolase [Bacilli bacterium]
MERTHNKLVRDKILDIIRADNCTPEYRVLSDKECLEEANKKLLEEVNEYLESGEISELCDIEEVLRLIISLKGLSYAEFEDKRKAKNNKRGSFTKRIFLISEKDNEK